MPEQRNGFRTNDVIVYPTHGVGQIMSIEEDEIAETKLELYVISFEKEKLTVRVPTANTDRVGMRKLSEANVVGKAFVVLKGLAQVDRGSMWNRRIAEHGEKIKSGSLISIAEVVRDLYRPPSRSGNQSFVERELYESALDRMAREISAIQELDREDTVREIEEILHSRTQQAAAA